MRTVNVMMSTYNGELYIKEQLQSIIEQVGVNVKIFIRDDGSKDNTISIIEEYMKSFHNIILFKENNIGWKKSFLRLTKLIELQKDEYYAFSDQDDIWKKNKLVIAIKYLEEKKSYSEIRAYCSNQTFVNRNLEHLVNNSKKKYNKSDLYHVIVNGYGMGCTEVFSSGLFRLIRDSEYNDLNISHDVIVSILGTYFGFIYRDENSYILYRQHSNNAGSTHKSLYNKIINSFNFKDIFIVDNAKYLLKNHDNILSNSQKRIILSFYDMEKIGNKFKLIFNKKVSRDTFFGTFKIKMYILLYKKKER